jgi:hypothetical protein
MWTLLRVDDSLTASEIKMDRTSGKMYQKQSGESGNRYEKSAYGRREKN